MNIALHPTPMTADAFLAWPGDGSGRRFNLVDGIARPMSPASPEHSLIQLTVGSLVLAAIEAAGLDLLPGVEGAIIPGLDPTANVRVPDVVVTAAPNVKGQAAFPTPILVIEILSPGNQAQTRDNIRSYASVPTMQEIVLVHSQRVLVEVQRRRADGAWITETIKTGGELVLATVQLRCLVAALYKRTWLARD